MGFCKVPRRRSAAIIAVVVSSMFRGASARAGHPDSMRSSAAGPAVEAAMTLLESGQAATACRALTEEILAKSEDPFAYRGAAICAIRGQDEAVMAALNSTAARPALTAMALGMRAFLQRKPDEAVPHLERAVALAPTLALAWSALGATWIALGEHERALPCLKKAVALAPPLLSARKSLETATIRAGVHARLISRLRKLAPRWSSLRSPRVPPSGERFERILQGATAAQFKRAMDLNQELRATALESRERLVARWSSTSTIAEVDLWAPLIRVDEEKLSNPLEAAVTVEAWLVTAESFRRQDVLLMIAGMAIEILAAARHPSEVEPVARAWAQLRVSAEHQRGLAVVTMEYGSILRKLGRLQAALRAQEAARDAFQRADDRIGEANARHESGKTLLRLGHNARAMEAHETAGAIYRTLRERLGEANASLGLAEASFHLGKNQDARAGYEAAAKLYRAENHPSGISNALTGLASVDYRVGANERALSGYREAQDLARTAKDRLGEANALIGLAEVHHFLGASAQALEEYAAARELYRQRGALLGESNVARAVARVLFFLGRNEEALSAFTDAIALSVRAADARGEGSAEVGRAEMLFYLGRHHDAVAGFRRGIALAKSCGDVLGEAQAILGDANVSAAAGRTEKALEGYRRAEALYREAGADFGRAHILRVRGHVQTRLGNNAEAASLYRAARELYDAAGDLGGMATTFLGESKLLLRDGRLAEALQALESASALSSRTGDALGEGNAQLGVAETLHALNRGEESIDAYRRAAALYHRIGDALGESNAARGEADVEVDRGRSAEALPRYEDAARFAKRAASRMTEANAIMGRGTAQRALGQPNDAMASFRAARAISESVNDPLGVAWSWFFEGRILADQNDCGAALSAYGQAANLFLRAGSQRSLAGVRYQTASCLSTTGRREEAIRTAREAIRLYRTQRSMGVADLDRTVVAEASAAAYDLVVELTLAAGRTEDAWAAAEEAHAPVLRDLVRRTPGPKSSAVRAEERDRIIRELAAIELSERRGDVDVVSVAARRRRLERSLELVDYLDAGRAPLPRAASDALGAQGLRKLAESRGPILSFYATSDQLIAFLASSSGAPLMVHSTPISWNDLGRKVAQVKSDLAQRWREGEAAASLRELWEMLIGPFESALSGEKSLVLIPHGPLHELPFAALLDRDQRRMFERWHLSTAPSASILESLGQLRSRTSTSAIPFIALTSGRGLRFPSEDARKIGRLFPENQDHMYREASSLATYSELAPRASSMLIATHGRYAPLSRYGSFLELDPMPGDDGRLRPADIAMQPLFSADLVTLAACDTGRGAAMLSDERLDFSRAFLIAGAASVLVTRWKIPDDHQTTQFLVDFFQSCTRQGAARGCRRKDVALSEAQKQARDRGDPAAVWAAWVLVGDRE